MPRRLLKAERPPPGPSVGSVFRMVGHAESDDFGAKGRQNLIRAVVWQRNLVTALFLEGAMLADAAIWVNKPPAADLLVVMVTVAGVLGALATWLSATRRIEDLRR